MKIDEKYLKKIFINILMATIVIAYFLILNTILTKVSDNYVENIREVLSVIFLFISIIAFEISYKKENDEITVFGIEILVLALYTLTAEHIIKKYNFDQQLYLSVAAFLFSAYFVFKSLVIYTKGKQEIVKKLSDVKEITKKDEPIKKEATKKHNPDEQHTNKEKKKIKK